MFKRWISILSALAILVVLTACDGTSGGTTTGGDNTTTTTSGNNDTDQPVIYEQEGVHHAVLMYPASGRDVEKIKPYAARMKNYMPTGEYLFDTFIFLQLLNTSGVFADHVGATKEDWLSCLDRFFRSDTDIPALEEALDQLKQSIGDPPSKRKVIIGIPYPHKATENFGDVDGDGKDEDFLNPDDRRKVLNWYIQEAIRRFNDYEFENIELWGFYWNEEAMASDEEAVAMASDLIHDAGYKFMWIPYYEAPGYEKGSTYFDVTIMQPNYAFNDWTVDGKVGPERLENTWEICQENGFGIEIEIDTNSANDVANFQRYMAYGASDRLGYQQHVNGYYLGAWFVENTYFSSNKDEVAIYELLCDYVTGKKVEDPDTYHAVTFTGETLEVDSGTADRISSILLSADTATLGNWNGTISAEFYRDGKWYPAGWLGVVPDPTAETIRTLTIPTEGTAEKIRLKVESTEKLPDKAIHSVSVDHTGARTEVNYCYGKTYTLTPDPATRPYDDDGTVLSDGDVSGKSLGWWNRAARVVIDLGSAQNVDGLELFVTENTSGGISLPTMAYAAFSEDAPAEGVTYGIGARPANFRLVIGNDPAVDGAGNGVYRIDFDATAGKTRYISLYVEAQAGRWMMLTDVRVRSGNTAVPIASYKLVTKTQAQLGSTKTDTGIQLTNGSVEYGFGNGCVAWDAETQPGNRELVVDLEETQTIHKISLYCVSSPVYANAYAVRRAEFYTSEDGVNWTAVGTVDKSSLVQSGERIYPVSLNCKLQQSQQARYLKVVITPGQGVCAISEITAS